jgi:hypothetical protein
VILAATAAQAAPVALHQGSNDPVADEDWTLSGNSAQVGAAGDTTPAWQVADGSGDAFYFKNLTQSTTDDLYTQGWRFDVTLRVVDAPDAPDFGITTFFDYGDDPTNNNNTRRFGMQYGSDTNGNAIVTLFGGTGSVTLNTGNVYNDYSLVYDPNTSTASLFINGSSTASATSTGQVSDFGSPLNRVIWGNLNQNGTGNYNLVSLAAVPEPASAVLIGLGSMLMLSRCRRDHQ